MCDWIMVRFNYLLNCMEVTQKAILHVRSIALWCAHDNSGTRSVNIQCYLLLFVVPECRLKVLSRLRPRPRTRHVTPPSHPYSQNHARRRTPMSPHPIRHLSPLHMPNIPQEAPLTQSYRFISPEPRPRVTRRSARTLHMQTLPHSHILSRHESPVFTNRRERRRHMREMSTDPRGATGYRRILARSTGDTNGSGHPHIDRRGVLPSSWRASLSPGLSEREMETDIEMADR